MIALVNPTEPRPRRRMSTAVVSTVATKAAGWSEVARSAVSTSPPTVPARRRVPRSPPPRLPTIVCAGRRARPVDGAAGLGRVTPAARRRVGSGLQVLVDDEEVLDLGPERGVEVVARKHAAERGGGKRGRQH